ncbi:hypothetical protein OSG_eHP14_00180 [environmental Halophage eHP-14]|nr:hypothetical protein OSG_eHP14_00180 [environmental Halophage eHP-14]
MTLSFTINGTTVTPVISARTVSAAGADTGEAEVTVVDSSTNRGFSPGDPMTISWDAGPTFTGEVIGRPSRSNGRLTYRGAGGTLPLKHINVYRTVFDEDSGTVVSQLINKESKVLSKTNVHVGDDPSNWDSIAPIAEPYDGGRAGLYESGTDLLFIGCRSGHSDELRTTYSSVPTAALEDGFLELDTRIISPLVAEWSLIVELQDGSGTSYRWTADLEQGPQRYTLSVEDAEPEDSGLDNNELRYRFVPDAVVATPTGFLIDDARTVPFRLSDRGSSIDAANVETTDRKIFRRFDGSLGSAIDTLATEDQASWWVQNDSVAYQPGVASKDTTQEIIDGSTAVVAVDADRDFESVRNEILVQGDSGIESIARSTQSIEQYGRKRSEKVSDPQLVRDAEAEDRAEGELDDQAFDDAAVTFTIANLDFAGVQDGQRIDVTWPDEDISGTRDVLAVEARSDGTVDVTVADTTV